MSQGLRQVYRFTTYTIMLIYIFSSCRIFLRKSGRSLRSWVQLLWSRLVANKLFFSWISCPETEWSFLTSKPCTFPMQGKPTIIVLTLPMDQWLISAVLFCRWTWIELNMCELVVSVFGYPSAEFMLNIMLPNNNLCI